MPPRILDGLSRIAGEYDALLCDAWGVIHNGQALFPGVADALSRFREECGPVVIITNAPRLSDAIPPQLDRLGLPRAAYDGIVTSGDATRQAVLDLKDQTFFRLGPADKDESLFEALPVQFVEPDDAEAILCTGLFDDQTETPDDYRDLLGVFARRKVPMVCANPDRVVQFGDKMIYCAGSLADIYEQMDGPVILAGKPHPPIYAGCRRMLEDLGKDLAQTRMLAIGDGLQTDILGANREGIDVVFVANGIFGSATRGEDGTLDSLQLDAMLSRYSVSARYALDALTW